MSEERFEFDVAQVVSYWLVEADEALQVAGHLAVEKVLKALYASRMAQHAPPLHNLLRLARAAGLEPDEAQTEALITITAFNIEARYPDLKRAFRQKCTAEFTARQMAAIQEVFQWLRSLLP